MNVPAVAIVASNLPSNLHILAQIATTKLSIAIEINNAITSGRSTHIIYSNKSTANAKIRNAVRLQSSKTNPNETYIHTDWLAFI